MMSKAISKAWNSVRRLGKDQEGGALIEYTVLLAILLVAVITSIIFVGGWISNVWSNLHTTLANTP